MNMIQTGVITTVFALIWFANIAINNGRLLEFFISLIGIGFFGLVFARMQMNKPVKGFSGFDGYEQERIGFALAAAKRMPEYKDDLMHDAWVITQTMRTYNMIPNEKYIGEVMLYHLKNTPDYYWDEFAKRAGSKKVYKH